eukprot:1161293-Pelagomonas_calceolata.AAC.2
MQNGQNENHRLGAKPDTPIIAAPDSILLLTHTHAHAHKHTRVRAAPDTTLSCSTRASAVSRATWCASFFCVSILASMAKVSCRAGEGVTCTGNGTSVYASIMGGANACKLWMYARFGEKHWDCKLTRNLCAYLLTSA